MEEIALGINILFDTAEISWDNARVKMQLPERINRDWIDNLEQELLYAHNPTTADAERIQNINESKYTPAELKQDKQRQLLK